MNRGTKRGGPDASGPRSPSDVPGGEPTPPGILHCVAGWPVTELQYCSTVRLGRKWHEFAGHAVQLCDCSVDHVIVGEAAIVGRWVGKLADLPKPWLQVEHEPRARTMPGLIRELANAYGAEEFDLDSTFTVLMLKMREESSESM